MDHLRAFGTVLALVGVLLCSFEWVENGYFTNFFIDQFAKDTYAKEIISAIARWQVFTVLSSLITVTLLYKWLLKTPLFACIEGAAAFLGGFLALKSFYWIYLHYNADSTTALLRTA